jgi:hypothetical protein
VNAVKTPRSPAVYRTGVGLGQQSSRLALQQTVVLFDYLVRSRQQHRRHIETERLRGPEIDHKFKCSGLLDWQIAGALTFQNAVNVRDPWPTELKLSVVAVVTTSIGACAPSPSATFACWSMVDSFVLRASVRAGLAAAHAGGGGCTATRRIGQARRSAAAVLVPVGVGSNGRRQFKHARADGSRALPPIADESLLAAKRR